jgi:hypothetical protein
MHCTFGCREVGGEISSWPETVEDDKRPERPPQNDLGDAVLRFLEKQPHSSSREITKDRKSVVEGETDDRSHQGLGSFGLFGTFRPFEEIRGGPEVRVVPFYFGMW